MLGGSVLRRVLAALRDGRAHIAGDVCMAAGCSIAQLVAFAEAGFLRFPSASRGQQACITPRGLEKFQALT